MDNRVIKGETKEDVITLSSAIRFDTLTELKTIERNLYLMRNYVDRDRDDINKLISNIYNAVYNIDKMIRSL